MEKELISVVVPIYKAEKYLYQCLDSLLAQTFDNFEIVLIDDGSPDGSGKIGEEYARKYDRVRIFHQSNKGVTFARHYGVQQACGEWVTFVDADDTIPPYALSSLYAPIADGCQTNVIIGLHEPTEKRAYCTISPETFRHNSITGRNVPPSPCARLFRRSILTDFVFDIPRTIVKGEDMLMNIRVSFQNELPIYLVMEQVYNYRNNAESVTHHFHPSIQYEVLYHKERMRSILTLNQHNTEKFRNDLIQTRLDAIYSILCYNPCMSFRHTEFFQEIMRDICRATSYIPIGHAKVVLSPVRLLFFRMKIVGKKLIKRILICV